MTQPFIKSKNNLAYLPCWNIFSKLLIDNATNGHHKSFAGHIWCVIHPKVVLKVLAEIEKGQNMKPNKTVDSSKL